MQYNTIHNTPLVACNDHPSELAFEIAGTIELLRDIVDIDSLPLVDLAGYIETELNRAGIEDRKERFQLFKAAHCRQPKELVKIEEP